MSSLEERAEEAARKATCRRCETVLLDDPSAIGMVFGRLRVPMSGVNLSYQLCGKCGLGLREFLQPSLVDDRAYQTAKVQLLTEHW